MVEGGETKEEGEGTTREISFRIDTGDDRTVQRGNYGRGSGSSTSGLRGRTQGT